MALKWSNILAVTLAALLFAGVAFADVVEFRSCDENVDETFGEPIQRNCTINAVSVTPCPEAAEGKPCKIKRGNSVSLAVDFTPLYADQELTGRAYWANQLVDLPLLGMDTNACNYTSCPIKANQKQTYDYKLEISNFFPVRAYDVKWKLWNDNTECCFLIGIKLLR
ncbi:MD-2-related lipid-recognition protein-like [Thrips palmi]|uniref:MD-2-related lipid-recognition protein-like n=1 Tax=Thrips palmi TaxID=161013 RepID=A0A6P8ZWA9_THRPL|nr:MD-2-related lipid-recognition protein-like [Thrips palmi]